MRSILVPPLPLLVVAVLMIGCAGSERNASEVSEEDSRERAASAPDGVPPGGRETVLFLGTSLTAGLGLQPEEAFPALIQQKVDSAGLPFRVVNAGVSGETSAGALRRLDWLLRQDFEVLVLETGANDMLRGTNVDSTRANIQAIVDRVRAARPDVRIVLAGMLAAPNLGRRYGSRFREIYPSIAKENEIPLIPFLLEDVGGVAAMNQADGMHPNQEGHAAVAATVWEVLEPVLREEAGAR